MGDQIQSAVDMEIHDGKLHAATTYDAAADAFDHPALTFWGAAGQGTIDQLDLEPGMNVLDVASGSGASAIPAAEAVAPSGRVIAADLSERLLELAAKKAGDRGVANLDTRVADMERLGYDDGSFDAVVCVFGIFFLPDMTRGVTELWRMVKPGGRLAITTWDRGIFEPLYEQFFEAVAAERPDLVDRYNPWDSIVDRDDLVELFESAGATTPTMTSASHPTTVNDVDDWWAIVMGTGLRGTVLKLSSEEAARVRSANDALVSELAPLHIRADVHYAIATMPT